MQGHTHGTSSLLSMSLPWSDMKQVQKKRVDIAIPHTVLNTLEL